MAQAQTSPIRSAVLEPVHVIGLVLALIALAVMGFPTLAVGAVAALELFYLLVFAQTPAYRRRIQLKAAQVSLAGRAQALELRATQLRRDERRRYQAIHKLHQEILQRLERQPQPDRLPISADQLHVLDEGALEFALALQSFREQLSKNDPDRLRGELEQLRKATGPQEAQEARRQTQAILEQRIAHLTTLQQQLATLEAQLQVMEHTFQLFKEQLSTLNAPVQLPADVGEMVREVEATRQTLQEMRSLELAGPR